MSRANTERKNKGHNALYFAKWHYTTSHNKQAVKRQIRANGRA